MRILDLFCGAGGAGMGYHLACPDAEIVGIDLHPQKRYPFTFIQADAVEYLQYFGEDYDFIHASPPCQLFSGMITIRPDKEERRAQHVNLIPEVRQLLLDLKKPYVIENVPGARSELRSPVQICGTIFGLRVIRHRLFETNFRVIPPGCKHEGSVIDGSYFTVVGNGGGKAWIDKDRTLHAPAPGSADDWRQAMGIDWMTKYQLTQAIPPAYTQYLFEQWRKHPLLEAPPPAAQQLAFDWSL
jgi:DNA (cytosine-5)-methyltransferase 1